MATKDRHLVERDGRFYARLVVPQSLREAIGKTELREPLGPDKRVARYNLTAAVARLKAQLEGAALGIAPKVQQHAPKRRPTSLREIALQNYRGELGLDEALRMYGGRLSTIEPDDGLVADLKDIAKGIASDALIEHHFAAEIALRVAAGVEPGSVKLREEMRQLAEVRLEVQQRIFERLDGDFTGEPTHPLLTKPKAAPSDPLAVRAIHEDSLKTIAELLPQFLNERQASSAMKAEHHVSMRMFDEFMGGPAPVFRITSRDVIRYKDALLATPAFYSTRFKGKTLPEAIAANAARKQPLDTLQPKTVNDKWLSRLHAFLAWCVRQGIIPDNPAANVRVEFTKATTPPRLHFLPDELGRIFGTPLFAAGTRYDETQWAMLISLFAGTRPSELAQIKLRSVREERGVLVFAIEERTKNAQSRRVIPIHSRLIGLGLDVYLAGLRSRGETHLFPQWFEQGEAARRKAEEKEAQTGRNSTINEHFPKYLPKRVNVTYLPRVGVKAKGKDFYSFRHTFKTGLSLAGVPKDIRYYLTGHTESDVGAVYEHGIAIDVMKDAIERLSFDGLDLTHMTPSR